MNTNKQNRSTIPAAAIPTGSNILAFGEKTNHSHGLYGGAFTVSEIDTRKFLKVEASTEIRHQEHAAFDIFAGDYEVRIVSEFDHLENAAREVRD